MKLGGSFDRISVVDMTNKKTIAENTMKEIWESFDYEK